MHELLEEAIVSVVRNLSLSSLINLWGISLIATLSAWSILKVLVIAGYLAVLKLSDWKRLFFNVFMYLLGMGFSYLVLEIIIVQTSSWTKLLVPGSSILYLIIGVFLIIFGVSALGFFGIPILRVRLFSKEDPDHDYLMAFLLGMAVVFVEALSCPICNPTLKLVSAILSKQGYLFAVLVFVAFFLGQSTLPLLAGIILGPLKHLLARNDNYEYVQIAGAIILILVGLNLLWLL